MPPTNQSKARETHTHTHTHTHYFLYYITRVYPLCGVVVIADVKSEMLGVIAVVGQKKVKVRRGIGNGG